MAEYSNLSATINAQIRANGVQAITGPVLNAVLTAMVNVLGDGYRLNGVAVPADNPGSPDNRVAYLASQDGTYTNFGGLTISGEVALLLWDSAWTKATLFSIDTAVTPGSGNLVTSGAVDSALTTLANNIAAAYMQLVPAATEGNLAEFDNAGQVRDAGIATSDVATKDGHYPNLFAGFAGNLVDTRSAGTHQGPFAFRQSGGDGVNYMRKILGRTEAFNQLVGDNDTEVTVPNGHKYFAIIGGTASVATSDGSPISVTGGVDIVTDLTLMYGAGNEPATADQFRALHPLPYYNYNAGVLKNNAATGIKTVGFNQWDEEWESGSIDVTTGESISALGWGRSKNYIPCQPSTSYYFLHPTFSFGVRWYDANKNYIGYVPSTQSSGANTTPSNCAFMRITMQRIEYNHDICINLSDPDRNGIYEPYWKREIVLGLNNLPCHDENNNAVVVNGLDGVGSSYDEAVVENGMVTKIIKRRARVDLASLAWGNSGSRWITDVPSDMKVVANGQQPNWVCSQRDCTPNDIDLDNNPNAICYVSGQFYCKASENAPTGILDYELATPKVLTLDNPIPALIEVDNLGTEKRLPEDTADNPQAPFECDSNYSVSTANLVRLLNL